MIGPRSIAPGSEINLLSGWCYRPTTAHTAIVVLLFLLRWFQDLERAEQRFVNRHHCAGIVEFSTVIRRREQGYQLSLGEKLVSVFDNLMRSADQIHVVFLQEPRYHIWTESERHSSVVFAPSRDIFIRI